MIIECSNLVISSSIRVGGFSSLITGSIYGWYEGGIIGAISGGLIGGFTGIFIGAGVGAITGTLGGGAIAGYVIDPVQLILRAEGCNSLDRTSYSSNLDNSEASQT